MASVIFGDVIPKDVRALSGNSTTTHIVLVNGASIDVPISVIYVYGRLGQYCPGIWAFPHAEQSMLRSLGSETAPPGAERLKIAQA
jgi:hypothetical protein